MAVKYGTNNSETITGTAYADTIWARGGNDTVLGR
jgi:Ca2+-binding RTX toxin-like protein